MHLLILPFILAGLSAKIFNKKLNKNSHQQNSQKQLDIIISSLFTHITPTDFGDFKNDKKDKTSTEKTAVAVKN
jgi:hypothetical protein